MYKIVIVVAGLMLALNIPAAHADWSIGGYLESLSLDTEKASEEGIEDSANVFGFVANDQQGLLMVSMGLGIIVYKDNEEFKQAVQYFNDDIDTESSDATGLLLHFDVGPRFQLGQSRASYFALKGGIGKVAASERSISNCSNCYSEDINIDGGPYVQAALGVGSDNLGVALQFSKYTNEEKGLSSGLRVAISWIF